MNQYATKLCLAAYCWMPSALTAPCSMTCQRSKNLPRTARTMNAVTILYTSATVGSLVSRSAESAALFALLWCEMKRFIRESFIQSIQSEALSIMMNASCLVMRKYSLADLTSFLPSS